MKRTFAFIALTLLLPLLSACQPPVASSSSLSSVTSSSASETSSSLADVDYVSQVHLALDYVGHDFLTDGIGQVRLKENVDGDTTHFYDLNSAVIIKSRYLCIDTPESTGQIQPWGKAASHYTASQINAAQTIVISSDFSTYGPAKADSTGARFLSYVWVSDQENAPLSALSLLNLMIVQNGYSATKSASDTLYASYFFAADAQAQRDKLVIWSGLSDPDFIYSDGVATTLQLLRLGLIYDDGVGDYVSYDWTDAAHNKVAFDATVAMVANGNAYVYMDYPDLGHPDVIVRYGLYVFAGYRNITPLTHVGWKLNLVGNYTLFNGNPQLTSVNYNPLYHTVNDITVLDKSLTTYTPPEPSTPAAEAATEPMVNVVIQVNGLHGVLDGTYADNDNGAFTIACLDGNGSPIALRFTAGTVTDRNDVTKVINETNFKAYFCVAGETFNVLAPLVKFVDSSGGIHYQLSLCHNADLVFNS